MYVESYSTATYTFTRTYHSYSTSSDLLATGPKPPMDYPLDNPLDLTQRSWTSWCISWLDFRVPF